MNTCTFPDSESEHLMILPPQNKRVWNKETKHLWSERNSNPYSRFWAIECFKYLWWLIYLYLCFICNILVTTLNRSKCTEQSPWEAVTHLFNREINRVLCNPNVSYRLPKRPPLILILLQIKPILYSDPAS